jgi:SAM-dependent methyltransferase
MNYLNYVKSQVSKMDFEKIKSLNLNLNTKVLADFWPEFVDFKKRSSKEIPFILKEIKNIKNPIVFDSTLGSGATSIGLKKKGINNLVSNEIDSYYIKITKEEAKRNRINLQITSYDWRELDKKIKTRFNVALCLGNSLTYLFKKKDQLKTLTNFRNLLKEDGKLIIDERNYPTIIDGKYKHSMKYIYCGNKVSAEPIFANNKMVVMEYKYKNNKAHLVIYPFKKNELIALLKKVGFKKITTYYDYEKKNNLNCEFITYVAEK